MKQAKNNFWVLVFEGAFFFFGLSFLNTNSVVSVFIETYTGSIKIAGLASTIFIAMPVLAQLIIGPFMPNMKSYRKVAVLLMLLFRPLPLLMIPVFLFVDNNNLLITIFIILIGLLWASDGLAVLPWNHILARTIPKNERGKLLGNQQIVGNILGLTAGFIIKTVLQSNLTNDYKYAIIFSLSGIVMTISALIMTKAHDAPNANENKKKVRFFKYYQDLLKIIPSNKTYIHMIIVRIMNAFGIMLLPFVILFGKRHFLLTTKTVSTLIYLQIIGALLAGYLLGKASEKFGNKSVISLTQSFVFLLALLATITALLPADSKYQFLIYPMTVLAGMSPLSWMGYMNYTIDIVDDKNLSHYFVFMCVINFPLSFLSYVAGNIIEIHGFLVVFIVGCAVSFLSFLLSLFLPSN